jgi:hypothetical protein
MRPLRRWKRNVCPARRFLPCTRPWPIRICAGAEPSGGSGTSRSASLTSPDCRKFSRWADRDEISADRLGEHNDEVLHKLLSLTDQEIAGLYANKVIVRDPLLDP